LKAAGFGQPLFLRVRGVAAWALDFFNSLAGLEIGPLIGPMSMRAETNRERVLKLMAAQGAAVSTPGRVYFTGGVSAVLFGWRDTTVDVNLKADPEPAGFFEAMPKLKDTMDINIELACPTDFIPEVPGWRERSLFIAHHGRLDFYHFDFYSQALAKIERFHPRDRHDVAHMIESGQVIRDRLMGFFVMIQPALIRYPAIDPAGFEARVREFVRE
jgi:hypothetical protein